MEILVAECVMRWCNAHTSQPHSIRSLLQTICYHDIPELYTTKVLIPYVRRLLPDVRQLTCTRHKKHLSSTKPMIQHHKAPPEIYLLKSFDIVSKWHVISLDKRYTDEPITIVNRYNGSKKKPGRHGHFVLYDMDKNLDQFPVSAKLDLGALRLILEKAANLHFIIMY